MQFHVSWAVNDNIVGSELVGQARARAAAYFQGLLDNPKVTASGHFVGARAGYFIVEAESAGELFGIWGPAADFVTFDLHPLGSLADVLAFFKAEAGH